MKTKGAAACGYPKFLLYLLLLLHGKYSNNAIFIVHISSLSRSLFISLLLFIHWWFIYVPSQDIQLNSMVVFLCCEPTESQNFKLLAVPFDEWVS